MLYPLSYGGPGRQEGYQRRTPYAGRGRRPAANVITVAGPRVLVVDDSDIVRHLITLNLELEGFDVVTAVDGQDCLERVVDLAPALVTLDVVMPRLDGFRTAARLRQDPRTRHLKIVLVTASAQAADLRRGADIGVDAYLTKPFDPDELIRTVRTLTRADGR